MSAVTAAILARIYRRQGYDVEIPFSSERHDTQRFWREDAPDLAQTNVEKVVLCGVTFDETDPENCYRQLKAIENNAELEIWSHRWPDGYDAYSGTVLVPQYHLYTEWRSSLSDGELNLFQLGQIVYRDIPAGGQNPQDLEAALGLDIEFHRDSNHFFDRLLEDDPDELLRHLQSVGKQTVNAPRDGIGEVYSRFPLLVVELNSRTLGFEERALARFARHEKLTPSQLAMAVAPHRQKTRIYLARPTGVGVEPSVEWLVHESDDQDLAYASEGRMWAGPQDARHLRLESGLSDDATMAVRDRLVQFAVRAADQSEGIRTPPAGMIKHLHDVATLSIRNLDLLGRYTGGTNPELKFDPSQTRLLLDRGNRSGKRRATLILHLWFSSADAGAFLMAEDARNQQRLEHLLEGALLSHGASRAPWAGFLDLPLRLRLDIHQERESLAKSLPSSIRRTATEAVFVSDALSSAISGESRIGRALDAIGVQKLIVYNESDTIGPSIPYALILSELGSHLQSFNAGASALPRFEVLDLFSGSGVATRLCANSIPNASVMSVDLSIAGSDVGVEGNTDIIWLTTDARTALGRDGLVDRKFDLIGMDPPHEQLLNLVFSPVDTGPSLIQRVSEAAQWLVIYVGHATQAGRVGMIGTLLKPHYESLSWLQVGQEIVVICGPAISDAGGFDEIVSSMVANAKARIESNGWSLGPLGPYRPKTPRVDYGPSSTT